MLSQKDKGSVIQLARTQDSSNINIHRPWQKMVLFVNSKICCHDVHERMKALRQLRKLTTSSEFPSDVLTEYTGSWMLQCCKWSSLTVNDELRILRVLIASSTGNADSKKVTISTVLPQFARQLMNTSENTNQSSIKLKLECLKTFIDVYGPSCSPYRNDFSKFVFHCLERYARSKVIIKEAALCFVRLCSYVNKGQREMSGRPENSEEMWSSQFEKLIATCHRLFDLIYTCVDASATGIMYEEKGADNVINSLVELETMDEKNAGSRIRGWTMKLFVVGELLKAMLTCRYLACKSFNPYELLRLIRHLVVTVTPITLKKCALTNDLLELTDNLWHIHVCALDILNSLIICAHRNLVPYGSFICNLCTHTIKWSRTCLPVGSSVYVRLRCKVYSVLTTWIWVAKSSSSIEVFADDVTAAIIADIDFAKPSVQQTENTKTRAKKRRADGQFTSEASWPMVSASVDPDDHLRERVCVSTHRLLRAFSSNAFSMLKRNHRESLQRAVIRLTLKSCCNDFRLNDRTSAHPSTKCRLQALQSLLVLVVVSHYNCNSYIPLATKILESAGNSRHLKISSFCMRALNVLEMITHPRGPTLARFVATEETREFFPIPVISDDENCVTGVDAPPNNNAVNSEHCVHPAENESTIIPSCSTSDSCTKETQESSECAQLVTCLGAEELRDISVHAVDNSFSAGDDTEDATISPLTNEKSDKRVGETIPSTIEKEVSVEESTALCSSDTAVQSLLHDFIDTLV